MGESRCLRRLRGAGSAEVGMSPRNAAYRLRSATPRASGFFHQSSFCTTRATRRWASASRTCRLVIQATQPTSTSEWAMNSTRGSWRRPKWVRTVA
ncbi:hypothetical protein ASF47_18940 [Nocardioides sp. Leaf285]|nr:hypothetical protein ASF47_18940 [Nocardioides sp. Leaf285]